MRSEDEFLETGALTIIYLGTNKILRRCGCTIIGKPVVEALESCLAAEAANPLEAALGRLNPNRAGINSRPK